ncbi:hypothetical protein [Legionella clemsonensis]|uniref:Ankyrin repeats (3 copies) n=1 Tax=Legionella clemsonensis TaxID=1867846 RepID=A0A222P1D6_9GAMM|nr:hypothetical protein [Legionella clemsonensis]ASQ45678.1 hypothetical protein clem_05610 [Legionella clemsonensis]
MLSADKEFLTNLLKETALLLMDDITPHDYASLKFQIINQELRDELKKLNELLENKPEQFAEHFRVLCKERAKRNEESCLSFFALPFGYCNRLYWQIAERLFKPKTLGEMFKLLLSDNVNVITPEFLLDLPTSRPISEQIIAALKNPVARLHEGALSVLETEESPPTIERLTQFVMTEKSLFDVNNLVLFKFTHHQALFKTLREEKPALIDKLYQHNHDFQTLYKQMLIVNNKGQSPYEEIKLLIRELTLGGERFTGGLYASVRAQVAYTEFLSYLNSLPPILKSSLMTLKTANNITFSEILDDLNKGDCVETAAKHLQGILDNSVNHTVLNTKPYLTQEEREAINSQYGKKALPTMGRDSTNELPHDYLCALLGHIKIEDELVYLDLLIAFPPSYYDSLLKFAQINCQPTLPQALLKMLKTGILNNEQLSALNEAVKNNVNKLGLIASLNYAIKLENYDLLTALLSTSPPQRLTTFNTFHKHEYPLLKRICENSKAWEIIISVWPTAEKSLNAFRLRYLLEQNKSYPKKIANLLAKLSESELLEIVNIKDIDGNNLLQSVCYRTASLITILKLLPEDKRISVVFEQNNEGNNLLHRIDPSFLKGILNLLPENNRWTALTNKNSNDCIVLERLALDQIIDLLDLLPHEKRLEVFTYKSNNDFGEIKYSDLLKILPLLPESDRVYILYQKIELLALNEIINLLHLLPQEKRLAVLTYVNAHLGKITPSDLLKILLLLPENDRTPLLWQKYEETALLACLYSESVSPQAIMAILRLLPKDRRLSIILKENNEGKNLLRFLNITDCIELLKLLPEKDRFIALTSTQKDDFTLLEKSAASLAPLKPVLELLPEEKRLTAILTVAEQNKPCLDLILEERHLSLLEILPEEERLEAITRLKKIPRYQHYASNFSCLEKKLLLLPEKHRVSLLKEYYQDPRLSHATNSEELTRLLNLLSQDQREEVLFLTVENNYFIANSCRVIDYVTEEDINTILATLSKNRRLNALLAKNDNGQCLLDWLQKPHCLFALHAILPKDDWLQAIEYMNKNHRFWLDYAVKFVGSTNHRLADLGANDVEALQTILSILPEIPSVKIKSTNNELVSLIELHLQIKRLKRHGNKLQEESKPGSRDRLEGEKATKLAEKFEDLTLQFMTAKNTDNPEQLQRIKNAFKATFESGYREMKTHRILWRPILANIAIAATGVGLLVILAKYLTTGSAFFASTTRQKMVNAINQQFDSFTLQEGQYIQLAKVSM